MKQNKTIIKELRQELHYQQMMVRVDLRALRAGVRKCKEIAAKMRALQNEQATQHRLAVGLCPTCGGQGKFIATDGTRWKCATCKGSGKAAKA